MAKEFAKKFYHSKEWKKCREGYILSVHGLCEKCLAKGRYTPGFIVHHKKELTPDNINDPYITLNWDNLEYDCLECHNKEHMSKDDYTQDDLMFNEYGQLIRKENN